MGLREIGETTFATRGTEKKLEAILLELRAQGTLLLEQNALLREQNQLLQAKAGA